MAKDSVSTSANSAPNQSYQGSVKSPSANYSALHSYGIPLLPLADPNFARILERSKEPKGTGWPILPPVIYQAIPKARTYLDNAILLAMDKYRTLVPSDTFRPSYNPIPISNDVIRGMYEKANTGIMPLSNYKVSYMIPSSTPLVYSHPQLPTRLGEDKSINYH